MSTHDPAAKANKLAYALLVRSLADQEPRHGWTWEDLEPLTLRDIALICRLYATDVIDAIDLTDVIAAVGAGKPPGVDLPAALELACRRAVWYDVTCECEQRQDERDRERNERRLESAEAYHGVAGE